MRTLKPALRGKSERDDLAIAHLDVVDSVVRCCWRYTTVRRMGWDDAWQEGFLGMLRAAEIYDPAFGVPFDVYARKWVRKFLFRRMVWTINCTQREVCLDWDDDRGDRGQWAVCPLPPPDDDVVGSEALDRAMSFLSPRQKMVAGLVAGGYRLAEVATITGIAYNKVRRLLAGIGNRLRRAGY